MTSNYGFEPTLDGLNNIDSNNSTTENIVCDTIQINVSGTAPNRITGDSTINIANTQFVQSAVNTAGANYVDLTSTQTITGAKTFSNANTVISGALRNLTLDPSTSSQNTFRDTNQVAGICNIANNTNRTGAININTGSASTAPVNIGTGASAKTITLGDSSLGTNVIRGQFAQLRPSQSGACNVGDNMTSGFIIIGRGDTNVGTTTINVGNGTLFTGSINIGGGTTGNAPITIGSTASSTQTCAMDAITTFSKIPSCAVAPTTANHLCNKTYVDSVVGSVTLGGVNVWTNENDFTNIVKVKDPTLATYAGIDLFSSITPGIVINGAPGTTSALSGVNLNTNTLTVPIKNNQSLIRLRIPMNISAFGVPSFYFGQLDIIFNSITAITILKNGSFYKTVSVFDLLNFTGTTKSWTGWAFKGENARAYVGDVQFELEITTANTSVDTYTIGIAVDVAVNAGAVGLMTPRFLSTGDVNFTTTHAQSPPSGVTYISTDPASFFPYQINFGNFGNYIIGKGDIYIKTTQGGVLRLDAPTTFTQIPQCAINSIGNNDDLINYGTLNQRFTDERPYFNPVGAVIIFAGSTAPTGYLLCDGALYAQSAYPALFSVIFNTYGGGFPNFRVPNYNGAFLRGSGSQTVGGVSYSGSALGTSQQDAVLIPLTASNQGFFNLASGSARQCVARSIIGTDLIDTNTGILPRFTRTATENRPFNHTVNYCIKF